MLPCETEVSLFYHTKENEEYMFKVDEFSVKTKSDIISVGLGLKNLMRKVEGKSPNTTKAFTVVAPCKRYPLVPPFTKSFPLSLSKPGLTSSLSLLFRF